MKFFDNKYLCWNYKLTNNMYLDLKNIILLRKIEFDQ